MSLCLTILLTCFKILVGIASLVFCCCRRRKATKPYKKAKAVDDDNDWTADDDEYGSKSLGTKNAMHALHPRASSPAPSTQGLLHNMDTSYRPEMPPVAKH
jgi:hypothetical protein